MVVAPAVLTPRVPPIVARRSKPKPGAGGACPVVDDGSMWLLTY
jgi:hypothetical protein